MDGQRCSKMKEYSVYMHRAPSGRVYIGISREPEKRWNHGKGYCYNPYFWRCIQKYGWDNIEHIILHTELTLEEAKAKEISLIAKFKSDKREFGYNISGGGDGLTAEETRQKMSVSRKGKNYCDGRVLSEETRKLISESLKRYYSLNPNAWSGRNHSEETKRKLRERVFSEDTRRKMSKNHYDARGERNASARAVCCLTKEGEIVKVYPYATKAAKELNLDLSSIIRCCRGKAKTCGGYKWKYKEPGIYGWSEA